MFAFAYFIISFVIAAIVAVLLHSGTRRFVRDRLRYVDAVQRSLAPWVAGGITLVVSSLVVGILPLVGIWTAVTAALAVGSGVAAGARDIRKGLHPIVFGS